MMNTDVALLILRIVLGLFFAGHGAQKLFGWFDGAGLRGTYVATARLGFHPPAVWGFLNAVGEFGGGLLVLLGFLGPLGPVAIIADMTTAIATVHWAKPIWASQGGAELPLMYVAAAVTILLAGPGAYSLDRGLVLIFPSWVTPACVVLVAIGVALGLVSRTSVQPVPARARV
jgi:putative oxidoreductase